MKFTLLTLLSMVLPMANASQLGLVLSGGGAKGAYEVGVWQILHEAGIAGDVAAVSGTSIGAVNAALFASCPNPKGAERLWLENLGKVFVPNDRVLQMASERKFVEFLEGKKREYADIAGLSVEKLPVDALKSIEREARAEFNRKGFLRDVTAALDTYRKSIAGFGSDGLCEGYALRTVLESNLPKNWSGATPRVYVTALARDDWKSCVFCLNEGSPEDRILRLLASTAIPVVFPPVEIDGKSFVDGGWEEKGGDNVPIAPILDNHPQVKTVIVVYLKDERHINPAQRDRVRSFAEKKGVRLVEIIPSEDIGGSFGGWVGVFDASPETARRLIKLGRKDARKVLAEAGIGFEAGQPPDSAKEDGENV